MDTFFEQIVKKKKSGLEWLIAIGVWLLAVVVVLAVMTFIPILILPVLAGAAFGAWWLSTSQNKEYEYSVTNGDIDVDLIIAKRKRKRLVSVAGRKIECLLPYDAARVNMASYQRTVVAAPSPNESGMWYFTYSSKKSGHTIVLFTPEDRVLKALYSGLPKLVKMDTQRTARDMGVEVDWPRGGYGSGHGGADDADAE